MSVYKKNDKWYCKFSQDGRNIHRVCHGATDIKQAQKFENAIRYRLEQQKYGVVP